MAAADNRMHKGPFPLKPGNTPALETGRLILRKFSAEDEKAAFLIFSDRETNRFLPWYPLTSIRETKAFMEQRYESLYRQPQGCGWAICLKQDNIPIGYINVSMNEAHDLGYGLRREFWGRGIMTEGGQAVIGLLKSWGLPFITATHDRNNPRSGQVMARLGMHYQYSYEEQWQPKNISVIFRLYQLNLDQNKERIYRRYWDESAVHFVEKDL